MRLSKQKIKNFFTIIIALQLLILHVNFAYAADSIASATYTGVEQGIKDYLCTPTPPNPASQKIFTLGSGQAALNNTASNDLFICINKLYRFAITTASVVGVFFIVIAGYLYMSADGSQETVDKAKAMFVSTITSMVILMSGYVLLRALNPDLLKFESIQPPSVVLQAGPCPTGSVRDVYGVCELPNGTVIVPPTTGGTGNIPTSGGGTQHYVLAGYDIGPYATAATHEQQVTIVYNALQKIDFSYVENITQYMKNKSQPPGATPLTGQMVINAAQQYSVDPKVIVAIMQIDSNFGSAGLGAKTHNPGNVGNDDSGHQKDWGDWQSGVNAVAEWLSRHKSS